MNYKKINKINTRINKIRFNKSRNKKRGLKNGL